MNDAPVARADTGFNAVAGTALVIAAAALMANDSDVDGDRLTITSVGTAVGGSVSRSSNGDIVFNATSAGGASFTYTVSDGHGGTSSAVASVTVAPSHDFVGTDGRDSLIGTNAADTFNGKRGHDALSGLGGNDTFKIEGDAGQDQIDGGSGNDILLGSAYDDIVRVASTLQNFNKLERIDGGGGFDRILATAGDDNLNFSNFTLRGIEEINLAGGNDIVRGSTGSDTFRGGAGNDTFVFRNGDGADTILDFKTGSSTLGLRDTLDLRGNGISGVTDLLSRMHQDGADVLITLDATTNIRIKDLSLQTLTLDKAWII